MTLLQRAAFVRHQLQQYNMPVDEAPVDDETRETYNFAPGYHGLVYRADVPDYGAGNHRPNTSDATEDSTDGDGAHQNETTHKNRVDVADELPNVTRYKLQAMKWGGDSWLPFQSKPSLSCP